MKTLEKELKGAIMCHKKSVHTHCSITRQKKCILRVWWDFVSAALLDWRWSLHSPSRSAPSSTSPMSPVPADDSSSNRESVLRSNAMFSIPLVGVLEERGAQETMWCYLLNCCLKRARQLILCTTCRACTLWDPCPAQGWTQWCPEHLSSPHFQANLCNTQHAGFKKKKIIQNG